MKAKIEELRKKMLPGDWQLVAKMLNIKPNNAFMTSKRPDSKRFPDVISAIEKIVESREILLNQSK
jgi:hypothetical protein